MKLSRFLMLLAGLSPALATVRADNASLASIFTNSPAHPKAHPSGLRRPSLIFIACHGLAWGDLSCYGQTNFQTPNLDRLAAEGMRSTNYRAGGEDLASAQAALMTGQSGAPAAAGTLATQLSEAGYATMLIGEWSLGPEPWKQGFDEFAGFLSEPEADNYFSDFIWRYASHGVREGTNYVVHPRFAREPVYRNTSGRKGEFVPDFLVGMALRYVAANVPDAGNRQRPFFLFIDLPFPHSVTPGKDEYPVPTDAPFSSEPWPQAAKNRAALVTRLDNDIGRLVQQLKDIGMTNNVAVFVAGTTAPEKFADPGLNFLSLPDEVRGGDSPDRLRVPMIVRWPGHVPAGRVAGTPWSAADFEPTALELAGQESTGLAGTSVLPMLLGKAGAKAAGDSR
jgi:arylsulfatase A-like enzyme